MIHLVQCSGHSRAAYNSWGIVQVFFKPFLILKLSVSMDILTPFWQYLDKKHLLFGQKGVVAKPIFWTPPYDIMRTSSEHHTKILRTFREHLENICEHLRTFKNIWEHLNTTWTHLRTSICNICEHLRASWENLKISFVYTIWEYLSEKLS